MQGTLGPGEHLGQTSGRKAMNMTTRSSAPHVGDLVEIHGHQVGEHARLGEILEVLGEPGHPHFRVRWEDGRESIFYPSSDAIVRPARKTRKRTP
jgi:hypothetical protein